MPGIPVVPGGELTADVVRLTPPEPKEPSSPPELVKRTASASAPRPPATVAPPATILPSLCTATA